MNEGPAGEPNEHVRAWLRAKYDHFSRCRRNKGLAYDDFAAMVDDENRPLWSIAAVLDVTVQSVSTMYRRYIAPLDGGRRRPFRKNALADKKYYERMLAIPYLGFFARRAIDAGLSVEPVFRYHGRVATRQLRVNGKLCMLQIARSPQFARAGSKIAYAGYQINIRRQRRTDALVLITAVPGYFQRLYVVPTKVFRSVANGRDSFLVLIPLHSRTTGRYRRPKVNWRKFQDRLDLLH